MTVSAWDTALDLVLLNEGGLNLDADDPGGRTAYGIAERYHPEAWRAGPPTKAQAEAIYRESYWGLIRGDDLPPPVGASLLDMAVQHGVGRAVAALQWLIGVNVDSRMGPMTLGAVAKWPPLELALRLVDVREAYLMLRAGTIPAHARRRAGYLNRCKRVRQYVGAKWG